MDFQAYSTVALLHPDFLTDFSFLFSPAAAFGPFPPLSICIFNLTTSSLLLHLSPSMRFLSHCHVLLVPLSLSASVSLSPRRLSPSPCFVTPLCFIFQGVFFPRLSQVDSQISPIQIFNSISFFFLLLQWAFSFVPHIASTHTQKYTLKHTCNVPSPIHY